MIQKNHPEIIDRTPSYIALLLNRSRAFFIYLIDQNQLY